MTDEPATARIEALYRYPAKGLSADALTSVEIGAGKPIAYDRAFAIENGASGFDPLNPVPLPKTKFLMLMSHERLATLATRFDAADTRLTISRDGKDVASGRLDQQIGRQLIEQFLGAYMSEGAKGAPKIVHAPGHAFADMPDPLVSLVNLASVRDLERVAGVAIDPLRFRANIYIDGIEPWAEFKWIGRRVTVNGADIFFCRERIERCAAINVDPASGARDMTLPRTLMQAFDHMDMGVYLEAIGDATLTSSDIIAPGAIHET